VAIRQQRWGSAMKPGEGRLVGVGMVYCGTALGAERRLQIVRKALRNHENDDREPTLKLQLIYV
jgi:hypothetical protein